MSNPFYIAKSLGIILTPLYFVAVYLGLFTAVLSGNQIDLMFQYVLFVSLGLFTFGRYYDDINPDTHAKRDIQLNQYTNFMGYVSLLLFVIVYVLGFII